MEAFLDRLREMRTLVEAAPVRYGMTAIEMCEKAAVQIETLDHQLMTQKGMIQARDVAIDRLMSTLARITDYADVQAEVSREPESDHLRNIQEWARAAHDDVCKMGL